MSCAKSLTSLASKYKSQNTNILEPRAGDVGGICVISDENDLVREEALTAHTTVEQGMKHVEQRTGARRWSLPVVFCRPVRAQC
jgi:hypothetical protein